MSRRSGRTGKQLGRATLCVIQARTGSSRLPGKVLQPLGGVPMLEFMLGRVRRLAVDDLVVATSDLGRDDPVAEIAERCGVAVVRGSETDVLARFVAALDAYPADTVVRLTADCPLTDPEIIEAVLDHHHTYGAQYTSNVFPRSFPKGLDVEVCTATALRTAGFVAVDPVEREHVTPFLYRRPEHYRLENLDSGLGAGAERWTVDTAEDLESIRHIVARVGRDAGWREILSIVGRTSSAPAAGRAVLRPANDADSDRLLAWRNDPEAVRWSTSALPIDSDDHARWFESVVHNPAHRLRIGEVDGDAIGFARVDVCGGVGTVSITVAPEFRGRGFGRELLALLNDDVSQDCQVRELSAIVHSANEASLRAFQSVGFAKNGMSRDGFCRLIRAA